MLDHKTPNQLHCDVIKKEKRKTVTSLTCVDRLGERAVAMETIAYQNVRKPYKPALSELLLEKTDQPLPPAVQYNVSRRSKNDNGLYTHTHTRWYTTRCTAQIDQIAAKQRLVYNYDASGISRALYHRLVCNSSWRPTALPELSESHACWCVCVCDSQLSL